MYALSIQLNFIYLYLLNTFNFWSLLFDEDVTCSGIYLEF